MRISVAVVALLAVGSAADLSAAARLQGRPLSPRAVQLSWEDAGPVELWRSSSRPDQPGERPSSCVYRGSGHAALDSQVASGTDYFYELRSRGRRTVVSAVAVPPEALPPCRSPELRIDKAAYVLEVWDGGRLRKRYPVALGSRPQKRKLSFDNASTPEGCYRITGRQPQATYYRAFDLDYPTPVDVARYNLLQPGGPIGGEIQIHGQGIAYNWTFGCVAMRNPDIDELFSRPELCRGTSVKIFGGELAWSDLDSPGRRPFRTPAQLGEFQQSHGLKVTCLWDLQTRKRLR